MIKRQEGKIVLVTEGSGGIGLAAAKRFLPGAQKWLEWRLL